MACLAMHVLQLGSYRLPQLSRLAGHYRPKPPRQTTALGSVRLINLVKNTIALFIAYVAERETHTYEHIVVDSYESSESWSANIK